jgi:hypothetical protein
LRKACKKEMKKIKGFVELALHLRYNIEIRARSSGSGVVLARLGPLSSPGQSSILSIESSHN